ncbi:MAG TPA: glycine cleavage system aminomethyltransferase GcvT [Candidatus Omnitrophota bacterium]|nr:glycine cleavage system aminomethyltransferase GcvT [Candidatus Omnitrophota bacterium]HPD85112.1 glycine cleavage system aminomethyltransferase GcvT [Candidatus Omnitrophota bacterium]HRZ03970.1 glycine cleavage system aminomethyltransferase GcvT [Candidatus Omnitrophota bacterium]
MFVSAAAKQTPLYPEHLKLHARMVPFGGWDMPVQYEGILSEYEHTRRAVAIFDTCHMGEFIVEGDGAQSGLEHLVTSFLTDMPLKACRYTLMLNVNGGVIDDLIVYRIEKEKWMIVVNAANIDKDAGHIAGHLTENSSFLNISQETGKLDVQGPLSRDVLSRWISGIEKLNYYEFGYFKVLGENVVISRTGYTGELGFEIYFPWEKMPTLWQKLLDDKRVKPAGLGARDVLRAEMCYSLYGQDIDDNILPLEAGLDKFINFDKDFIGRDALLKQKEAGLRRKMIYFIGENRRSPRHNHRIYSLHSKEIGVVTTGTFSPGLNRGIGMGLISTGSAAKGEKIFFGDDKNKISAEVTGRPFYKSGSLKN